MSKVLVTGGCGFIGSHLVDKLIKEGREVVVVDDLSGGSLDNLDNLNPDLDVFLQKDCRNTGEMDHIFEVYKPDIVYHLAANAAENKAQFSPIDITSRNYDAFIKTLTPFIKYGGKRIVVTSSIAVYGALQTPFKETDPPNPEDLYGISKYAMEETLKVMSKVHDFEYVITRPHNVYGPRQCMTDPYRNVVTIFMNKLLKGEPYYIYGDGEQRRCFSYIDDVVEALYKCGFEDVAGKIFNIGSDKDYSVNELSDAIQQASGIFIPPIHIEDRPQEVKEAISDHTEAKKYLNYKDRTTLLDGLTRAWKWAKTVGFQQPVYTDIEIDSPKLPSNWRKK